MSENKRPTSEILTRVVDGNNNDTITVEEIKNSLNERGFGLLMAVSSLPLCIPFPAPPGYTTFFSIPLFIFSIQMILGMDSPWLPKWVGNKRIKRTKLAKFIEKAVPLLRKIEKLLKPRMINSNIEGWEKLIGVSSFIFSISIAIPIPLTNLPPGYGILIMSLGLLSKDGLTILIGLIVGIMGVILTIFVLSFGAEIIESWLSSEEEETVMLILQHFIV